MDILKKLATLQQSVFFLNAPPTQGSFFYDLYVRSDSYVQCCDHNFTIRIDVSPKPQPEEKKASGSYLSVGFLFAALFMLSVFDVHLHLSVDNAEMDAGKRQAAVASKSPGKAHEKEEKSSLLVVSKSGPFVLFPFPSEGLLSPSSFFVLSFSLSLFVSGVTVEGTANKPESDEDDEEIKKVNDILVKKKHKKQKLKNKASVLEKINQDENKNKKNKEKESDEEEEGGSSDDSTGSSDEEAEGQRDQGESEGDDEDEGEPKLDPADDPLATEEEKAAPAKAPEPWHFYYLGGRSWIDGGLRAFVLWSAVRFVTDFMRTKGILWLLHLFLSFLLSVCDNHHSLCYDTMGKQHSKTTQKQTGIGY